MTYKITMRNRINGNKKKMSCIPNCIGDVHLLPSLLKSIMGLTQDPCEYRVPV